MRGLRGALCRSRGHCRRDGRAAGPGQTARLHSDRGRRRIGFLSGLRRTRAIGGSLVAIGLVGIVATASLGILGGTAGANSTGNRSGAFGLSADTAPAATAAPAAMAAAGQASGSPLPAAAPLEASATASAGVLDATGTTGPDSKAVPPVPAPSGQVASGDGAGSPNWTQAAVATSTGLDARLVWLGGFGLLLLAGLGVLIAPLIRRRRTH